MRNVDKYQNMVVPRYIELLLAARESNRKICIRFTFFSVSCPARLLLYQPAMIRITVDGSKGLRLVVEGN